MKDIQLACKRSVEGLGVGNPEPLALPSSCLFQTQGTGQLSVPQNTAEWAESSGKGEGRVECRGEACVSPTVGNSAPGVPLLQPLLCGGNEPGYPEGRAAL